jgi:hypothetical protein
MSKAMDIWKAERALSVKGWLLYLWAIAGVLLFLWQGIWKLALIAWEPIRGGNLNALHWSAILFWCIANAYMEGYRGFQQSFSPMVVERAYTLEEQATPLRVIFAPLYSMAFFAAPRAQMIVTWSITGMVVVLILLIRLLPQPWRGIVDSGVVVGLGWGALSIAILAIRAILGYPLYRRARRRKA